MTPESEKYAKIGKFDKRSAQNHANLRNLIFPLQTFVFCFFNRHERGELSQQVWLPAEHYHQ